MEPYEQDIWIMLSRILSAEADSSEERKFKQWLEEDPENRVFFENLEARWKEDPDKNAAYQSFLFDRESGVSRLRHKIREEEENNTSTVAHPSVSLNTNRFTGWKIAASILLVIGMISAWAGMELWSPPITSYATSSMEQRIIILPDGSTVRLNKNSSISFREGLSASTRKITLNGEAFFEVEHEDRPFVIHAGNAIVRDIGTSFNVKQQRSGRIIVAMKEGRATLRSQNMSSQDASMLTKNEIGILDKGEVSTVSQESIQNYLSWIEGRLVFKNVPFDEVIEQLDSIYDIDSSLEDAKLKTLNLTAHTQNTSLKEVLDMIALSLDITYRKKDQQVVWMKEKSPSAPKQKIITDTTVTKD